MCLIILTIIVLLHFFGGGGGGGGGDSMNEQYTDSLLSNIDSVLGKTDSILIVY